MPSETSSQGPHWGTTHSEDHPNRSTSIKTSGGALIMQKHQSLTFIMHFNNIWHLNYKDCMYIVANSSCRIHYGLLFIPHLIVAMPWGLGWCLKQILLPRSTSHTGYYKECAFYWILTDHVTSLIPHHRIFTSNCLLLHVIILCDIIKYVYLNSV